MKIYAHRGASAYAPENTMAAFHMAHSMGAHGVELDVQLTMDGKLVVIHDHILERTSNGQGMVKDHTLAQLRQLDFGGWFSPAFAGEQIPTLHEVLAFIVESGMEINIELKTCSLEYDKRIAAHTVEMVQSFNLLDKTIISSFDHRSVLDALERDTRIKIGLLYSANLIDPGDYACKLGAQCIHPHYAYIDEAAIENCGKNGIAINVWTVDDVAVARQLRGIGTSVLITNKPDIMLSAVLE